MVFKNVTATRKSQLYRVVSAVVIVRGSGSWSF